MYSALDDAALPAPGFPIRRSTGQRLFSTSPWLIAAVHVLLRLLVPRHPPCALTILTVSCSSEETRSSSASYLYALPRCQWEAQESLSIAREELGLVQFSSSAEAGERRSSARGPWKLSSVLGAAAEPEGSAATQADPVDI